MCMPSSFDGHKTLVCQVGDLKAGDRYRTPEGGELMVIGLLRDDVNTQVVDVTSGLVSGAPSATNLGRDRAGRLYASRSLNTPTPTAIES